MTGTVLLVLNEGFDDFAFLSCQVIFEENNKDVIIASKDAGTIKGIDSSVITVALNDALSQEIGYSGFVLIGGEHLEGWDDLEKVIREMSGKGQTCGFVAQGIKYATGLLGANFSTDKQVCVDGNIVSLLDPENSEEFAETIVKMF